MATKRTFKDIINGEKPVLVDFYADWCGPCKMLAPVLKKVSKDMSGQLIVLKVDVDKNQALSNKLGIKGVPTMVIYKKGKIVWRQSGVLSDHQIKTAVEPFL